MLLYTTRTVGLMKQQTCLLMARCWTIHWVTIGDFFTSGSDPYRWCRRRYVLPLWSPLNIPSLSLSGLGDSWGVFTTGSDHVSDVEGPRCPSTLSVFLMQHNFFTLWFLLLHPSPMFARFSEHTTNYTVSKIGLMLNTDSIRLKS